MAHINFNVVLCLMFQQIDTCTLVREMFHWPLEHELPQLDHRLYNPVPDHQKVEAYEEPQNPSNISHQGAKGEGLLFSQNLYGVGCKVCPYNRSVIMGWYRRR